MDTKSTMTNDQAKELLDAQARVWRHALCFYNTMALKSAMELGIPDIIQSHGKSITLSELANLLPIHPTKAPSLTRLMRILVHSKFFCIKTLESGEEAFGITVSSQLLLKNHPFTQNSFSQLLFDPIMIEMPYHITSWFQSEAVSPFHIAHNGKSVWEVASCMPEFSENFNKFMASDSQLVSSVLLANDDFKGLIQGIESLVDVGGGIGTMTKAIADAYPSLECIVFDLPHVVDGLQGNGKNLKYVAGDMFQAIPHAHAVLLKWVLHDWTDDDCIKILKQCKAAIPSKEEGGRVLIIDMVIGTSDDSAMQLTQFLSDMHMLSFTPGGKERNEEEWKKLFFAAGYSDYKIHPIDLGSRSVIEVYP